MTTVKTLVQIACHSDGTMVVLFLFLYCCNVVGVVEFLLEKADLNGQTVQADTALSML